MQQAFSETVFVTFVHCCNALTITHRVHHILKSVRSEFLPSAKTDCFHLVSSQAGVHHIISITSRLLDDYSLFISGSMSPVSRRSGSAIDMFSWGLSLSPLPAACCRVCLDLTLIGQDDAASASRPGRG